MMTFKDLLTHTKERIYLAHALVVAILFFNVLLFTQEVSSIVVQIIVIIAVGLHHFDDVQMSNSLLEKELKIKEDNKIFDRNIIVSQTNEEGVITYVNKNYEKITGYTAKEMIGFTHAKIRGNSTSNEFYKKLWVTLKKGKEFSAVFKNKTKDGKHFWVDTHISPIIIKEKITGYKSLMFDVTSKYLLQQELVEEIEEHENRFEFIINSSRDGFWDYNLLTKEFFLSEKWKKRLGFNENEELRYLDYLGLIPENNRFEHHSLMSQAIEDYPSDTQYIHFNIEYPLISKSGEPIMIEDVGNIFFNKEREVVRITGFHRDITQVQRQSKIMESQNRIAAMGDMIGNIAHQWRQPIAAINNTVNELEFDIELDELSAVSATEVLKTTAKVKEYTAYLSETIDDFRDLSSADKKKSTFVLIDVINKAYAIVENAYKEDRIAFVFSQDEEDYEIVGYKRELIQVLINILNNAKDVLVEREVVKAKVRLVLSQVDSNILITIEDNGGGIPEDVIEKVFEPYFTTKHQSLGTGIGLYMSRKIITNYFRGSLDVRNEKEGAKFTLTLPTESL